MAFFRRNRGADPGSERSPRVLPISETESLTDAEWWSAVSQRYESQWRDFAGSPETFGGAGKFCYENQDFGQAALFYGKAIDLMHTLYGDMQRRQPSAADAWIVDGYTSAAGASHALHPEARLDATVREVTHRLRTISTTCDRIGLSSALYRSALDQLAVNNPDVPVDDVLW